MNLRKSLLGLGSVMALLIRILLIIAAIWLGNRLVSNITYTYHDTHVICMQVTHDSHSCK